MNSTFSQCKYWIIGLLAGITLIFLIEAPLLAADCDDSGIDGNIFWSGIKHDTFDLKYRSPFGSVRSDQEHINLTLRTCAGDAEFVKIRIWDDFLDKEHWLKSYSKDVGFDPSVGKVDHHHFKLPIPHYPTILYYYFEITDGSDRDYYTDDDAMHSGGGLGVVRDLPDDSNTFQITVYDKDFVVPSWLQGAVVYQIFPDRFRNGNLQNDPKNGGDWIYGLRARHYDWDQPQCDPRGNLCPDEFSNQFFGGDLEGIREKLSYLKDLGVTLIYLNPIMHAPSNHAYDVQDYKNVDPYFGDLDSFRNLTREALAMGIRVIVDGSFNHTSSDHPFFDYYSRWNSTGSLIHANGPGFDDGSGACESPLSPYRSWYYLPHRFEAALNDPRTQRVMCPRGGINELSEISSTYEAWFGHHTLPKLRTSLPAVQEYFFSGGQDSVAPFWIKQGASGWRLDVAADVDPGATKQPDNTFWEGFRSSIKQVSEDAILVGEEWGDGSAMLLGHELDTILNYRFRNVLLGWAFDTCKGNGCQNGNEFSDNDSKNGTVLGPIKPLNEQQLINRLKSIEEDYPPGSWNAAFNLMGSHDTNRQRFILSKISGDDQQLARKKQKLLALFQFVFPGSPSLYYGDEAGSVCAGKWRNNTFEDDPYNRCVFPWEDRGLKIDHELLDYYKKIGIMRAAYPALRRGKLVVLKIDNQTRQLAIARKLGAEAVVGVFNRSGKTSDIKVDLKKLGLISLVGIDLLNAKRYKIKNGILTIKGVAAYSGTAIELAPGE